MNEISFLKILVYIEKMVKEKKGKNLKQKF